MYIYGDKHLKSEYCNKKLGESPKVWVTDSKLATKKCRNGGFHVILQKKHPTFWEQGNLATQF